MQALRGIDLQVEVGQFVALKGRSGSGKTTLLNCLGGLDEPSDGRIEIYGRDINGFSEKERTNWRRSEVGFIFQSLGLIPTLAAFENVEFMLRIAKMSRKERAQRAYYLALFRQIIKEEDMTMLMATHDNLVNEFVDQVMHLQDGVIKDVVRSA